MFLVTVAEKGGGSQQIQFEKPQVTIGRLEGNDIVLSKGNVSKYHSRLVAHEGKIVIEDLKSTNGTFVNKKRIAVKQVVRPSDEIAIGDYVIKVQPYQAPASTRVPPKLQPVDDAPEATRAPAGKHAPTREMEPVDEEDYEGARGGGGGDGEEEPYEEEEEAYEDEAGEEEAPPEEEEVERRPSRSGERFEPAVTGTRSPKAQMPASCRRRWAQPPAGGPAGGLRRLQKDIHDRLISTWTWMDADGWATGCGAGREGDPRHHRADGRGLRLPEDVDREEPFDIQRGPGPWTAGGVIANDGSPDHGEPASRIERKGQLASREGLLLSSAVLGVIRHRLAPVGRRIGESSPLVDARLKDGSRVSAIIALALKGPCHHPQVQAGHAQIEPGPLQDHHRADGGVLEVCVKSRKNIISGTGSGRPPP
jgi:pilus assembly protein CpaF